jgi:hypothetical protein
MYTSLSIEDARLLAEEVRNLGIEIEQPGDSITVSVKFADESVPVKLNQSHFIYKSDENLGSKNFESKTKKANTNTVPALTSANGIQGKLLSSKDDPKKATKKGSQGKYPSTKETVGSKTKKAKVHIPALISVNGLQLPLKDIQRKAAQKD